MHQSDPVQGELSFELLAEIAVGATARVELCRVVAGPLKRELVAVKRLHPHIAEDPQFVDMFRDEVWMTAALKHRNVVEVVGWGQDMVGPWLAVEFVKGVSLQRLMKTVFETGERFTERIKTLISHSHVFIPLLTEVSHTRPWVHQETGFAIALRVPVLPIAVDRLGNFPIPL